MLQQDKPEDFVIATGVQYSVRDFVELAAKELDITLKWEGAGPNEAAIDEQGVCRVAVDSRYYRPAEVDTLLGDASKARQKLGWKPSTSFPQLVSEMVSSDLKAAMQERLIAQNKIT